MKKNYEHIKTIATDWSLIDYFKLPKELQFTVTARYVLGWPYNFYTEEVKQKACYVKIVRRRDDKSFFDFDVLDNEFTTIRGKFCKGISQYLKIYNDIKEF